MQKGMQIGRLGVVTNVKGDVGYFKVVLTVTTVSEILSGLPFSECGRYKERKLPVLGLAYTHDLLQCCSY